MQILKQLFSGHSWCGNTRRIPHATCMFHNFKYQQSVYFLFLFFQQMPYYVHIARFMPHVEIVQNHTSTVRRLFIRGDNGKVNLLYIADYYSWCYVLLWAQVYPYLVVNDSSVSESRREERLLQLLRMMNMFLEKQKVSTCNLIIQYSWRDYRRHVEDTWCSLCLE